MLKERKVVLLPCEKGGVIYKRIDGKIFMAYRRGIIGNQHLYVLGNHEDVIKEGDWIVDKGVTNNNYSIQPYQVKESSDLTFLNHHTKIGQTIFKIIATSDKSLSIPLLPEFFTKEYVRFGSIDKLNVSYTWSNIKKWVGHTVKENFRPKVDKNNVISILPIPEQTYTSKQVKALLKELITQPFITFPKEFGIKGWDEFDNWVEKKSI